MPELGEHLGGILDKKLRNTDYIRYITEGGIFSG